MQAEIDQRDGHLRVPQEFGRRARDQHLPPMAGAADAGRPMDADAHIPPVIDLRRGRVQTDADPHGRVIGPGMIGKGALHADRGLRRVLRARKGSEERIALRVDLAAVHRRDRRTHEPPMVLERRPVAVRAKLPEQPRRPLDIGEQQRHRPARWLGHAPSVALRADGQARESRLQPKTITTTTVSSPMAVPPPA